MRETESFHLHRHLYEVERRIRGKFIRTRMVMKRWVRKLLCIRMQAIWALYTDTYTEVEHMYFPNGRKQKRFQQANVPHVQNPNEFNEHFKTAISFELFRVIFVSKGSTYLI